ncbi:MAG: hypothetical protein LBE47_02000, partial [Methanomassiliicoccaceae archaeon]|nr:hypothetical protein [Methanomassiliicoccaceae archaeon]
MRKVRSANIRERHGNSVSNRGSGAKKRFALIISVLALVALIGMMGLNDAKPSFGGSSGDDAGPLAAPFEVTEAIDLSDLTSDAAGTGWSYTDADTTLTFGIGSNGLGYELTQSVTGLRSLNIVIEDSVNTELMISGISFIGDVTLQGDACLDLYLNGTNRVFGNLIVPSGATVTVNSTSGSSDSLTVNSIEDGLGAAGTVTVNSGILTEMDGIDITATAAPSDAYIITGTGSSLTTRRNGEVVNTASTSISNMLSYILRDANDRSVKDVAIQLGDGTTVLNIGATYLDFGAGWNGFTVELYGSVTGNYSGSNYATVLINTPMDITSYAGIANIYGSSLSAIRNNSTGTLTLLDGTLNSSGSYTIFNASTGHVIIGGNTAVRGAASYMVYNANVGTITVNGNASLVTSASYAIYMVSSGSAATPRLTISGSPTITATYYGITNASTGSVEISGNPTITSGSGYYTVYNTSSGAVNISGGNLTANSGYTIYNISSGAVNISGGTLTANSGYAVYSTSTGPINISGGNLTATGSGYAVYSTGNAQVSITGGTLTASGSYVVYISASVTLTLSGGTITNTNVNNYAICMASSSGAVSLSGDPTVNGRIYVYQGRLSVTGTLTGSNTYNVFIPGTVTTNQVVVTGGAPYLGRFITSNANFTLEASGSNIVLIGRIITFDMNGGTGTALPSRVVTDHGTSPA